MLEVRALETAYGASQVLFGLDLDIGAGEVVTLLGRNGMGKSTTVRSVMGIVSLRAGSIRFDGRALHGLPSYRIAKAGLGLVPEGRQVFPNLTVRENLVATANDRGPWKLDAVYRFFPQLEGRAVTHAWGGPIDISSDRLPAIGSRHGGRVHFAHGYSGNGVGPARLAGRILAAIVDGGSDPIAQLPIVGARARRFPPEPFRYIGARMIREALVRKDEAEDQGRRPGMLTRAVTRVPRLLGYRMGH